MSGTTIAVCDHFSLVFFSGKHKGRLLELQSEEYRNRVYLACSAQILVSFIDMSPTTPSNISRAELATEALHADPE